MLDMYKVSNAFSAQDEKKEHDFCEVKNAIVTVL